MKNVEEYMEAGELVDCICSECKIPSFRMGMTDEEIAKVCRWIGVRAPGSRAKGGETVITAEGFDVMIFITITEFPRFFEKHLLGMVWRN